jgi:hypothetical protein
MTGPSAISRAGLEKAARSFPNGAIDPRELNALYDAAKNGRTIATYFLTGLYSYIDAGKVRTIDYMPLPVASNLRVALDEAGRQIIKINISYDRGGAAWRALCTLQDCQNPGEAKHAERDQALSRAIMSAVCMKRILAGAAHE